MTEDEARGAIVERLRTLTSESPGEQAIEFVEPATPSERTWWTWSEVGAVRDRLAGALAKGRVPDGAAVAIVMRQCPAMLACELGALALARTALLLSPIAADRGLNAEIAELRAAALVAHAADWARPGFAEAAAASGSLAIEAHDGGALTVRCAPAVPQQGPALDCAVTVLTSGTTGPPKRLPVPWATFVRLGGGPDGRPAQSGRGALILSLPLVTLGGLLSLSRLVFLGRPIAMFERFDVHLWAALVKEHRPATIGAPPPVVQMILDADISPDHFEGVTAYLTSSASVPPDTIRRFEQRYGIPVLLSYGATEFLNSVTGWTEDLWRDFGATKLGSVGRPHPGVRLRVVDPATSRTDPVEVPVGEEGILEVDPPQRAGNLPAGWLRTNDRARVDEDGFVWILGRADDVIVRGGFKIDLTAVEAALSEHPDVEAAAAIGLADDRLGQVPAAVVSLAAGATSTAEELAAWVRERLPAYSVPTVIRVLEAIPRTTTMKPHRAEIAHLLSTPATPGQGADRSARTIRAK